MPDYTPPEDLIDLKTHWYAAQALADRIAAEPPAGEEITVRPPTGAGLVVPDGQEARTIRLFSDEQNARLNRARVELRRLTMEIHHHPWKREQPDRHEAEKALNAVALAQAEAHLWWARIAERFGFPIGEPIEPIDLTAPAQTLVRMPEPPDPYDGLAHTLQMRQALAEQEGRDD